MDTSTPTQHITLSRVAELANKSPQAVSNWRRRYEDFPSPVAGTGRRPLFDMNEIASWLRSKDLYEHNPGFATRMWSFMEGLRAYLPPSEAIQVTLSAVAWKTLSIREIPADFTCAGEDVVLPEHLSVPEEERSEAELRSRLVNLAAWANTNLRHPYSTVFEPLQAVAEDTAPFFVLLLNSVVTVPGSAAELESALDDLLDRAASQDVVGRTDPSLRSLATAILDIDDDNTILDAASGTGSFLLQVAGTHPDARCIGVEINMNQLRAAGLSALIAGVPLDLRHGDSLHDDPAASVNADRVFIDPPFNLRIGDRGSIVGDPRWVFGTPTMNYDFGWLQHAIARLTDHGRAVVVLPEADLSSDAGQRIRSELLKNSAVEAVVLLPRGSYPGRVGAPTLWALRKPNAGEETSRVLLIDATSVEHRNTGSLEWIGETVKEFRNGHELSVGTPRARAVSIMDLLADEANLVPSRWLTESSLPSQRTLEAKTRDFEAAVTSLSFLEPLPPVSVAERTASQVKVGDLVSNRSVKLIRTRALPSAAQQDVGTIPVLTPGVLNGNTSGLKYADRWAETNHQLTKAGDVAVWMAGSDIRVRVLADGGAVPSTQVQIVRVIDGSYLPEYLAVCLSSGHNARFLRGTTVLRPNLSDFEVPTVAMQEQKRIAEFMARIDGIRDQIRRASDMAAEFRDLVAGAVGEGVLRIG